MTSFFTDAPNITYKAILSPFRTTVSGTQLQSYNWIKFIAHHDLDNHRQLPLPKLLFPNL